MNCNYYTTSALSGLNPMVTFAKTEPFAMPPSLVCDAIEHPLPESRQP